MDNLIQICEAIKQEVYQNHDSAYVINNTVIAALIAREKHIGEIADNLNTVILELVTSNRDLHKSFTREQLMGIQGSSIQFGLN